MNDERDEEEEDLIMEDILEDWEGLSDSDDQEEEEIKHDQEVEDENKEGDEEKDEEEDQFTECLAMNRAYSDVLQQSLHALDAHEQRLIVQQQERQRIKLERQLELDGIKEGHEKRSGCDLEAYTNRQLKRIKRQPSFFCRSLTQSTPGRNQRKMNVVSFSSPLPNEDTLALQTESALASSIVLEKKWSNSEVVGLRTALYDVIFKKCKESILSGEDASVAITMSSNLAKDEAINKISRLSPEECLKQFSPSIVPQLSEADWNRFPKMYGKLKNRTGFQCKIRWKYFGQPALYAGSEPAFQWTDQHDEYLKMLVEKDDFTYWSEIETKMKEKFQGLLFTDRDCLARYQSKMNPSFSISVGNWTPEEDEDLRRAENILGQGNWAGVADCLDARTPAQCRYRWKYGIAPEIRLGRWSVIDDRRLTLAKYAYDSLSVGYSFIQRHLPGRTDSQCRERWMNSLNPILTKEEWSSAEDARLIELVEKHGVGKWGEIRRELGISRTDNQCWRRWQTLNGMRQNPKPKRRKVAAAAAESRAST